LVYRHNANTCKTSLVGQDGCAPTGPTPSFWPPFLVIWPVGPVIVGIVWLVVRTKNHLCPVCGEDVKRGIVVCMAC